MSAASWWCGKSQARRISRHAEQTNSLWSKAHSGASFPQVLNHFYAQTERCRTGEDKILFQNLSMKKNPCPSGCNFRQAQTLSRNAAQLPASCPAQSRARLEMGPDCLCELLQPSLLRLKLCCLPWQSGPHQSPQRTGTAVSFYGHKKSHWSRLLREHFALTSNDFAEYAAGPGGLAREMVS